MKQAYLALSRPKLGQKHVIRLSNNLEKAIGKWHGTTRVSPVFFPDLRSDEPLDDAEFGGQHVLCFLGPIHPKTVRDALPAGIEFWQTLGCYNVVLHSAGSDFDQMVALAKEFKTPFECWAVEEGIIETIEFSTPRPERENWQRPVARILSMEHAPELEEATKEFAPLAASAIARASQVMPSMTADLELLVTTVSDALSESADPERGDLVYELLGLLTNINAALSRQTSQSFSGTSPIAETESHYWTHSLLGTGTANLALWKLTTVVLRLLGRLRLPQRIAALDKFTDLPEPRLERLGDLDPFWYEIDHLGAIRLEPSELAEPLSPVVSCFSGRDGYRSTLQTLSAPLAVIGSCNSLRWTLLTLTHEISHIIIRAALGQLYPSLNGRDLVEASALIGRDPDNLWAAVRRYLLVTVCAMHQTDTHADEVDHTPKNLSSILNRWFREVEEIMVHVFDFLYFYGSDPEKYIRGIWLSWSVIPNIGHRIPEYVTRTLCAVLALHLRRGPKMEEHARDQVLKVLKDLQQSKEGGEYVNEAVRYIEERWHELRPRLFARRNLVRLVSKFLFSERLAADFFRESSLAGGNSTRGGYSFRVGEFDEVPIQQPLRFVEEYTQSARPLVLDSMWMLTMLAFNTQVPEQ